LFSVLREWCIAEGGKGNLETDKTVSFLFNCDAILDIFVTNYIAPLCPTHDKMYFF
jgi:hypothetical protein